MKLTLYLSGLRHFNLWPAPSNVSKGKSEIFCYSCTKNLFGRHTVFIFFTITSHCELKESEPANFPTMV